MEYHTFLKVVILPIEKSFVRGGKIKSTTDRFFFFFRVNLYRLLGLFCVASALDSINLINRVVCKPYDQM